MTTHYEDLFLNSLQAASAVEFQAASLALSPLLTPESASRVCVYRDGYYARVTQTLAATIFERAAELFGKDYIQGLIGRYLAQHPSTSAIMSEAVAGLPNGVSAPHERGVLALGLARWQVLIGNDPEPAAPLNDPQAIFLAKNHALIESSAPLFSLWTCREGVVDDRSESVLIYKSSAVTLEMASIAPELLPFVRALSTGVCLEASLALIPDGCEAFLTALIAQLAATSAFVADDRRSSPD